MQRLLSLRLLSSETLVLPLCQHKILQLVRRFTVFAPAAVVKTDDELDILTIRLGNGETFKVPQTGSVAVTLQDDEGISDILKLEVFSEMSLLHTLRVRYSSDNIYTFVGPILISVNPYKLIEALYSQETSVIFSNLVKVLELILFL